MTHDIDDLLEMIKKLEERIIVLERTHSSRENPVLCDAYYWEHG